MGIMLLILSVITLIVVLVLLFRTCMYKDYRWYRRYMMLRQRFFWNVFIRYILQSELKLLISAGSVLMLELQSDNSNKLNMIFPIMLASGILLCVLIFWRVLCKYK